MAKKVKGIRAVVRVDGSDYKEVTKLKNSALQKLRQYALRYYRTGQLFRSMKARTRKTQTGYDVIIEARVAHAYFLQTGTQPFLIRNAFGHRGLVVHHPGSHKHDGWFSTTINSVFEKYPIVELKAL